MFTYEAALHAILTGRSEDVAQKEEGGRGQPCKISQLKKQECIANTTYNYKTNVVLLLCEAL